MADSYYTSLGRTFKDSIMLESQPTGANVPTTAEIIHPDADAIFHVKESDPKASVKNARIVAYQVINADLLGPYSTREAALLAQEESS